MGGPRGSLVVANDFDCYLLAGDETALPAIGRRLEGLPEGARAIVFIEVADARKEQRFDTRAQVSLTQLHRNGADAAASRLLEEAIRSVQLPPGDCSAWVAAEVDVVRPIREHLLHKRGLNKSWTRVTGYRKRGDPDHDAPHN